VTSETPAGRRDHRRAGRAAIPAGPARAADYRVLRNPFRPQTVFSDDEIASIHDTALRVLEELGMLIALPEARAILARGGALVDESTQMVRIGRDLVEAALARAPRSFHAHAGDRRRDIEFALGNLYFLGGAGAPNVTDIERGRRAGTLDDLENLIRIAQFFDVIHIQCAHVEPQDVDHRFRHYAMLRAQLTLSDKLPFVYSRGRGQVLDAFEMIRRARGVSEDEFAAAPRCYTVVNTNSPRTLDLPMAQGIIDFARFGQAVVVSPFCLAGAMAPVTVAGAMTLQHAEALGGIVLAQLVRPGAPVIYGSFSSNVDLKSGAPKFGTPEHVKATLASGQLARFVGLPWRSGGGSSAYSADAQAANETQFGLWATVLAGATMLIHAAGWLEGGLADSYEKFITDVETLQTVAELCTATPADAAAIGYDAIADVPPGGHFFSTPHTMARFRQAFYEPVARDSSNFGNWTEAGAKDATQRAHGIWKRILAEYQPPPSAAGIGEVLDPFIAARKAAGGALPES
jgi:trimethylamine--corrinoid protein Co-methyltransferase